MSNEREELASIIEAEYDLADPFDEGYMPSGYALADVILKAGYRKVES